jgi:flagellar motor protein MotB
MEEINCPYQNPGPDASREQIIKALSCYPVQVIQVADTLELVLPTDYFIRGRTNQANPQMAPAFALMAQLLNTYSGPITIIGNTDNVGPEEDKLRRSFVQARSVSGFLWSNGIPLGRMKVIGCSDWYPVSTNQNVTGSFHNRRIEIFTDDLHSRNYY